MAHYTMDDAKAVDRQYGPKVTPEQEYAMYDNKDVSPMKRRLHVRMARLSHDIEQQRKSIMSRAETVHDEMIRLVAQISRGETRLSYTGWADSLRAEVEHLRDLDEAFCNLYEASLESETVVVADTAAAPYVELLRAKRDEYRRFEAAGNTKQMGGRNAKERDEGRVQALRMAAKVELIDQLLSAQEG